MITDLKAFCLSPIRRLTTAMASMEKDSISSIQMLSERAPAGRVFQFKENPLESTIGCVLLLPIFIP